MPLPSGSFGERLTGKHPRMTLLPVCLYMSESATDFKPSLETPGQLVGLEKSLSRQEKIWAKKSQEREEELLPQGLQG